MKRWNSPISNDEAARRAGGRRKYNKQRQIEAIHRQVAALNLATYGVPGRYGQLSRAEMARRLGVSRTTLWRYLKILKFRPGDRLHVRRPHGLVFEFRKGWRARSYWY